MPEEQYIQPRDVRLPDATPIPSESFVMPDNAPEILAAIYNFIFETAEKHRASNTTAAPEPAQEGRDHEHA